MSRVLGRSFTTRSLILVLSETALLTAAVLCAAYVRLGESAWQLLETPDGLAKSLLVAAICQVCLYYGELYDFRVISDRRTLTVRLLQSLGATSLVLAAVYFWFPRLIVGRGVFLVTVIIVLVVATAWRAVFEWANRQVGPRERLLLVGTGPASIGLARELHERKELGVEIVGFVDPDPSRVGIPLFNPGVIGTIEDIPAIVNSQLVDRVVVSLADARGKLPMDTLLKMRLDGVTFHHLASVYEDYTGKIAVENLRPSWLIFSAGFRKSRVVATAKRTLDIVVAAGGLVLATPMMAVIAAAIKLTSMGPVLYHQQRVGRNGRLFTIHKFRSMQSNAEAETGAIWATAGDARITTVGRFLRRIRLDELPQLWNVLWGEMSLVGPRPERPEFVERLTRQIPFYGQRHVAKPGLTGWAQVRYTYGTSVEDAMEKLQYDLFYIKNMSIALDLFILFKTVQTIVLRRGA